MATTTERVVNYLLVEDNNEHGDIVRRCVRHTKMPSEVHCVSNGADCLAYLAGEKPFGDRSQYPYPHVVLLDIRMPGILDGLQTLKAIRADSRHRSLVVMMLTTSDRDTDVSRAYELGANGYIIKSDDTGEMIEKLLHLQLSFETLVQLPGRKQESALGPQEETQRESAPAGAVDSFVQCDQNAAFDMLVSTYQKDRDETLELLKSMEQVNATRFTNLVHRFCLEERNLFAGGQDVDWVFIREVVMEKLPRYTSLSKMAGLVTSITAVLESNQASHLDNSSWQLWQGFCRAYLSQEIDSPAEPDEEVPEPLPWRTQRWKAVAIGAIVVLFALLLGVIVRELDVIIWELR
ncbi:MAG: response regulator [Thermoguttaceae bacterium]